MGKESFEKYIAEQANQFEVTPSDAVWEQLQGDLGTPASNATPASLINKILIGIVAVVGLVLCLYLVFNDNPQQSTEAVENVLNTSPDSERNWRKTIMIDTTFDELGNIFSIDTSFLIISPTQAMEDHQPRTKQNPPIDVIAHKDASIDNFSANTTLDENSLETIVEEEEDTLVLYYSLDLPTKQAVEVNKPLLLYFYNNDCSHCQQLEEETLSRASVKQFINEHFDMIRLDVRDPKNRTLIKRHKISISPSLVFINDEDEELTRLKGFHDEIKLLELLNEIVHLQNSVDPQAEENDTTLPDSNQTPFAKELRIFPNPSAGQFTIALNILKAEDTNLSIYNKWGQIVQELKLPMITGPWRQEFDLGNLPKGNYFIVIQQADQDLKGKLLLQ